MKNRIRIGIYYIWDDSWMGGVIYTRNLLKALNTLDDTDKPFIDVYCRSIESYEDLKAHTRYPYMEVVIINDNSLLKRVIRKIVRLLLGYDASRKVNMFRIQEGDVLLFPYGFGEKTKKLVYWRPDFQEKHLPEFFSIKAIRERERSIRAIANRGVPIVFSSHDSENDFKRFYPEYNIKTFVVHFAVDHADFSYVDIDKIKKKFGIKGEYLLCANQFWKHKNHLFLFKSYNKALQKGLNMQLVCTGKLQDNRNLEYIEEVKSFIVNNNLSEKILLLGLISSDELHCLMKNSYAVIQPSLFEGWNTTVEDCKALNKFVFLSDIPVHREQAKKNICFFDPRNEEDLCQKLLTVKPKEVPYNYNHNLREFGENFLQIVKYVECEQQKT